MAAITSNAFTYTVNTSPEDVFKAFAERKISIEQLTAWQTERDALVKASAKSSGGGGKVTWKISEKGAISAYGMGRFPVTLYASQLARFASEIGNGLQFALDNGDKISLKDGEDRTAVVNALRAELNVLGKRG